MSTKIFHGYRLIAGVDMFRFAERVRGVMNPIRDQLDARLLLTAAVDAIDLADFKGEARPQLPIHAAYLEFEIGQDALRRAGQVLDHRYDQHQFEMTIGRDPGTERLHVLLFTEPNEFHDAFKALPEVEYFGYWNSTDRPDDVTDEQWVERREAWDRVLSGNTTPAECMFSIRLRGDYGFTMSRISAGAKKPGSLIRSIEKPTLRERAHRLASIAVLNELASWNDLAGGYFLINRETEKFSKVVSAYSKCLKPLSFDGDLDLCCSRDDLLVPFPAVAARAAEQAVVDFLTATARTDA